MKRFDCGLNCDPRGWYALPASKLSAWQVSTRANGHAASLKSFFQEMFKAPKPFRNGPTLRYPFGFKAQMFYADPKIKA